MDKEFKKFCENYEVTVLNDRKRRAKYNPTRFFTDPCRADIIQRDTVEFESEPVFTVEIPESRFRTLIEMEKRFFRHPHERGHTDMFQMLMDKEREESYMRQTNPAVQKAYEQYSIMLNLAGYQRKI